MAGENDDRAPARRERIKASPRVVLPLLFLTFAAMLTAIWWVIKTARY